ncbi:MAG TPA: Ig-like domain-containing protein [Acidimicrobiales bacterium]|nr:Ig-like domain-containing protein [Acidimicrobiales bacterium]
MRSALVLALVATGLTFAVGGSPAAAASITVNTAADIAPNGSGVFPNDNLCSLRAAIQAAQSGSNAHDVNCSTGSPVPNTLDVIQIDATLTGQTMTLTYAISGVVQPLPIIDGLTNPLSIVGPTTNAAHFVISGGDAVRPFLVGFLNVSPGVLTLANLTVADGNAANGLAAAPAVNGDGGAMYAGHGSQLTFDNVVFRDNSASARGGAVYAISPTITNDGGAYRQNSANQGGAIFLEEGPSTFNGYAMLLQGNSATDRGGAIASNPGASNPFIHIERSLIRDNTSPNGGVMYIQPVGAPSEVTFELEDSTITGNSSVFLSTATTQKYNFERSTFVNTGVIFDGTGGGTVSNSIIKDSSCATNVDVSNYVGTRNLISAGPCALSGMGSLGAVTNLSPTLAQNGGPEVQQTFALLVGSNAIDNGSSTYCGTIDARSVTRGLDGDGTPNSPQTGDCDIGAYEYAEFVVNFVTGTSSVNENAGTVNVQVRLRILNPSVPTLTSALIIPVTSHPTSTATRGAGHDFTAPTSVTFPAGSADGAIANYTVTVLQDDVAELFGELALLDLGLAPGAVVAEPKRHTLSIQDDDQAGVIVDDGGNGTTIAEATPAVGDTFVVRLQSRPDRELLNPAAPGDPASYGPPANVEMTIRPDRDCTVTSGGLTATPTNPIVVTIANADWQIGRTLTVNAVDDPWDEDLRVETAPHVCEVRFTFDSADPIYDVTQDAYEVDVLDNDVAGVNVDVVSGGPDPLAEGSTDARTYSVSLDTPPDPGKPLPNPARGPTTITFDPIAGCTVGAGDGVPKTLSFTGATFSTIQQVSLQPVQNLVVELARTCTATTSIDSPDPVYDDLGNAPAFAGTPPGLTASVQDYDPPTITDDPPFVIVTTDAGNGAEVDEGSPATPDTISVVLERAPLGANVTVTLSAASDPVIAGPQLTVNRSSTPPGATASLVFTPLNWNVPQQVEVRAVDDDYDEADPHDWTLSTEISSAAPGFSSTALRRIVLDGVEVSGTASVPVEIADGDTSEVVALATGGGTAVAEAGATDTVTVQLATHPYADVTVTVTADAQCTVDGGATKVVELAAADWDTPVSVAVAALDDMLVEDSPHPCGLTFAAASTDGLYQGLTDDLDVDVTDDEVAEVRVSTNGGVTVTEGGTTDTVDVVLSSEPQGDVTVTFAHAGQTTSPASITFTSSNWDTPQAVTITAVDDDLDEPDANTSVSLGITTTAPGYATRGTVVVDGVPGSTVAAMVIDDDVPGVTVTPTALDLEEGGAADTYTVVLDSEPTATVTVGVSATGLCSAGPASLTFTAADWDTPQTVTVTPGEDDVDQELTCVVGHSVTSIDPGYTGLVPASASGAVDDDDTAGIQASPAALELVESGDPDTYTIVLGSEPTASVGVALAATGLCSVAPASLTFTAADWDTPQTVTVTPGDDDIVHAQQCTVGHTVTSADASYAALTLADASGAVADDDDAGVSIVTGGPLTLHEATPGTTASYTVVLDTEPVADVVVALATADGQATATPTPLTFTAADWDTPQTVTVTVVDDTLVEGSGHEGVITHTVTSTDPAYDALVPSVDEVVVTIGDDETTTTVTASSPANDQTPVVATATVAGGDDPRTGTVQFAVDGTPVGAPVAVTDDGAQLDLGVLAPGARTITATYGGDALHDSSTGQVEVTVAVVPESVDDAVTLDEDGGESVIDVLANDVGVTGVEPDSWTQGQHGAVTCDLGECSYTPEPDFNGTDTFTYQATNGAEVADPAATVTVTVTTVNDSPEPGTIALTVTEGEPVTFDLLAGASDPDGDPLTVASYQQPAHGTVTCTEAGSCTYTPTPGYVGADSFTYVLSDGAEATSGSDVRASRREAAGAEATPGSDVRASREAAQTEATATIQVTAGTDPDDPDGPGPGGPRSDSVRPGSDYRSTGPGSGYGSLSNTGAPLMVLLAGALALLLAGALALLTSRPRRRPTR